METQCSQQSFEFQPLGARQVTAGFDGGTITSDEGELLLREVEAKTGLLADLADCFDDFRDLELVEHTAVDLLKQRVFALALGYEDLNDHDQLRANSFTATTKTTAICRCTSSAASPGAPGPLTKLRPSDIDRRISTAAVVFVPRERVSATSSRQDWHSL